MAYLDQPGLDALWKKVKNWTNSVHANSMTKGASSQDGLQLMLKNGAQSPTTLSTVTITKDDITALGIPSSDTKYAVATQTAHGLMSAADKKKLDGVEANANHYTHPTSAAGAKASGLYKVATDAQGHVTGATAVTKSDISPLESDPTVPAWAKAATKPSYKASEIANDANITDAGLGSTVARAIELIDANLTSIDSKVSSFELTKANKNSPTFTGTPKAPTAAAGTNTTQIATTAFVQSEVAAASTGAAKYQGGMTPANYTALTTYKAGWYWVVTEAGTIAGEACEIGDMVFCNTSTSTSGTKLDSHFDIVQNNISDIATIRAGAAKGATALQSVPSTYRTAAQQDAIHDATKANVSSPTFKGTPKAPTAAAGTNTTQIATTAFVQSAVAAASTGAAKYQGGMTPANYTALTTYKAGWYWVVTEAGTIAGEACEIGDMVFCNTSTSTSGTKSDAHFDIVQNNIEAIPLSVINALS